MDLELIRKLCAERKLRWTNHILLRLIQRGISIDDVLTAIFNGEIIEEYPDDYPFPSFLIMGFRNPGNALHIVCAINSVDNELWLITAYVPGKDKWMDDLKTRKGESK